MLIGAHVSTAGSLAKAVSRGEGIGCRSIQIFNQSPRAWKPTDYSEDDFAEFREAMKASRIESVIIHAIYLINTATPDPELAKKSREALGKRRLKALHLNDSKDPLGSRRDRHADIGKGEIGERGFTRFLSEPRFEGLPATMETPGPDRKGPTAADIELAEKLRRRGRAARKRRRN